MNVVTFFPSSVKKAMDGAMEILEWLRERNIKVYVPEAISDRFGAGELSAPDEIIKKETKLVISMGGDGTLLRASRFVENTEIPILGINLGSLGFLTEIPMSRWKEDLQKVLEGDYTIEERMCLCCEVEREGEIVFRSDALNDAVIYRGGVSRLLHLTINIDNKYAGTYSSDGLIISTPTGSTAYSLSAGGPIVNPDVRCFILTAICPHTLSARPLVISESEIIEVSEPNTDGISLSLDGQINYLLKKGDRIIVKKALKGVRFLRLAKNFYSIIREKLKWVSDYNS